ncbi:uncharacterized protein GIQ15_03242 [Arthroderma uncinatum]|uniref:uncharacterized protein n=1 Tax=Arthroderma uncinatum TaxID=74035 RepID=UPI00144AE974|nr:uncharacterized protein GIQ15_03242 [Arthroderma uncinatum]KAF3483918.1 hypothetical protein GIQ15_03242 [Arthroderma uncinatum]
MVQPLSPTAGSTDPPVSPPPHVNGASRTSSVAPSVAQSVAPDGRDSENQSEAVGSTNRSTEPSDVWDGRVSSTGGSYEARAEGETNGIADIVTDMGKMPGIHDILEMLGAMQRKIQQMETKMNQLVPSSLEPPTPSPSPPLAQSSKSVEPSISDGVSVEDTITAFRARASLVARAKILHMAKKFPDWKDRVFEQAKAVTCLPILENREETCPPDSPTDQKLWEVQNEWLYDYMIESIGPQFKEEIEEPPNRSAYLLWRQIESYCSLVNEDDRRYLIQKLMTINAKNDIEYISTFHRYYSRIRKLGFTIPDWMAQDLLCLRVSERAREMIQAEIDAGRNAKDGPVTLETDKLVARILNPSSSQDASEEPQPESTPSINSSIAKGPHSAGSKPSSSHASGAQVDTVDEDGKVSCGYCSMLHHTQDGCFYKYPERTSPAWQKAHKSGIEFFQKKAEFREKLYQKKQQHAAQSAKKLLVAPKPQPELKPKHEPKPEPKPEPKFEPKPEVKPEVKPESKLQPTPEVKPEPRPEVKPEVKPEPTQQAQPEVQRQPQAKSQDAYTERLSCNYCGQKGHAPSGCFFQFPETATADWRQKNKHLIEFHARKDKLRRTKLERLKAKQLLEQSKAEAPAAESPRPTSPENLLILDL